MLIAKKTFQQTFREQHGKPCIVRGNGRFSDVEKEIPLALNDEDAIRIAAKRAGLDSDLFFYFRSEAEVFWPKGQPVEQTKKPKRRVA